jgi:hypothetical protein
MPLPPNYQYERRDAAENLFVERALTYVETETYNTEFPPTEGLKYVPVDTATSPGAKFTSYKKYTRTGMAKLITERGQDVPNVKLFVDEYSHQFYRLGSAYEYTMDDLLAAQFAASTGNGVNLDLEHAIAAREAIDRGLDKVAAIGSATSANIPGLADGIGADVGLLGLLNQTNASTYTPANGAAAAALWTQKTPDEMLADLTGFYAAQENATLKAFPMDTILLPITQYRRAATTRMGDGSDESVISLFKKMIPGVTVDSWQYCDGAGSNGLDRAVGFISNKRFVRLVISETFRQEPPQYRDLTFRTICSAKTAGVITPYPISITYMDGI